MNDMNDRIQADITDINGSRRADITDITDMEQKVKAMADFHRAAREIADEISLCAHEGCCHMTLAKFCRVHRSASQCITLKHGASR